VAATLCCIKPPHLRHTETGSHLSGSTHGVLTSNKAGNFNYVGEFKNGGANGIGTFTTDEYQYVGEWKDDKRNGQGTLTFSPPSKLAGGKYVGEFKDDKFNGEGTFTFSNGQITEGIFKDDNFLYAQEVTPNIIVKKYLPLESLGVSYALLKCEGNYNSNIWTNCFGTVTYPSGNKYVGEFKDSKQHGQGTAAFADGEKYVGEFKYSERTGQGTYTYTNGDKYVGEFKNGYKHGQGTFTFANGQITEGVFKDDNFLYTQKVTPNIIVKKYLPLGNSGVSYALPKCEGNYNSNTWSNCFGTFTYNNGGKYVGEWKDNHRSGQGVMTYPYGQEYIGEWKNDKKHGQGALIYSGGRLEEGVWKDDTFLYSPKRNPLVIKK
jgi:hypothetical protein